MHALLRTAVYGLTQTTYNHKQREYIILKILHACIMQNICFRSPVSFRRAEQGENFLPLNFTQYTYSTKIF